MIEYTNGYLNEKNMYINNVNDIVILLNYLSYHSTFIQSTIITFGVCSCLCNTCIQNSFNVSCNQYLFCGYRYKIDIPPHPSYYSLFTNNETN